MLLVCLISGALCRTVLGYTRAFCDALLASRLKCEATCNAHLRFVGVVLAVLNQPCRDVSVIFGVFMLEQAQRVLKDIFGYDSFRGRQGAIIERVASGGDALVLMPTGGGKSLCFQVPALLRDGLAVVVSPLIALMDDQVATLEELGVAAAALNSTLSAEQQRDLAARIKRGEVKMLYLAPERLVQPRMLAFLQGLNIALFAIDEAHCVSQWGHDFRREYLQLGQLAEMFPDVPRIALTATADKRTREEIVDSPALAERRALPVELRSTEHL